MEGSNLATLDEALAFIRFCDEGSTDEGEDFDDLVPELLSFEDIDELLDAAVASISPLHGLSRTEIQSPSPRRKKQCRRSAPSSSTITQRRKKAELEELRKEAAQLEACLAEIRGLCGQQRALTATSVEDQGAKWHQEALMQYEERRQAEQLNWRLKEALVKQWRISNRLKGMMFKRDVLFGMNFVRTLESPYYGDEHFALDQSSMLMAQLEDEVEGTYRRFNQVYRPQNGPTPCLTSETAYGETCEGNTMIFVTTTPLDWPLKAAFNHVWSFLDSSSNLSRKHNTVETKVDITLPVDGASYHFHKLHFLRKYEDKDRIVIIWSDLHQMTAKNLRFRSLAHAVFTRSETDPLNSCVMYTNLKLFMDSPADGQKLSSEDIHHARDFLLRGMGRLMRQFWQCQQNRLLEVTSGPYK